MSHILAGCEIIHVAANTIEAADVFERAVPSCHSEERSDEESEKSEHRFISSTTASVRLTRVRS